MLVRDLALANNNSSHRCYYCCWSFLPICHQEGRQVGGSVLPKATREPPPTGGVHQNSEHIIVEPAKPTRQPSTQRWREEGGGLACPGLGLDPWGGSPWPGRPGRPGTVRRQLPDAGAILVFLGFSSATGSVALALPQEQVAFAAWHLSPEDDCQEGASPGIALCVLGVLA